MFADFVGVILFIFALLSQYMSACPADIYLLLLQSHMIRIHHKAFSRLFLFGKLTNIFEQRQLVFD